MRIYAKIYDRSDCSDIQQILMNEHSLEEGGVAYW